MQKKQRRKMTRIKKAIVYWKKRPLTQGTSSPRGKDAKANKAKPYSRKRHQDIILAYRNVLELPSARNSVRSYAVNEIRRGKAEKARQMWTS